MADLNTEVTTALGGVDKKSGRKNPTSLEGYYIGTRQVASPKSKTGFSALHIFQTQKGNVGVWGKTNLDQKMTAVTPGQMIRVTFTGMQETKNNPMYKYRVEVDAENTIDVGDLNTGDSSGEESEDNGAYSSAGGGDEPEEALDEEEAPLDETPPQRAVPPRRAAVAPDAARQAKVQALLASSRNKSN